MEADWEFEVAGDAPVIDGCWSGFVNLRTDPERVWEISECRELPALADVLIRLNGADSRVWTSKTDVYTPDRIDADEMDALPDETVCAIACYIDLLQRNDRIWKDSSEAEVECRHICACLRKISLRRCRVDLVIRRAFVVETAQLGATAYLSACGPTHSDTKERLAECLNAFTRVLVPH